jgi:hemerythrin
MQTGSPKETTFGWKASYSVQNTTMDAQHKKLISILDDLHRAIESGQKTSLLDRTFQDLIAYTKYHFKTEELLMEQQQYPGMADHKFEHQVLTRRVELFKQSYEAGKVALIPMSLLIFLQEWLTKHILGTDKKLGEYLRLRGLQ